MPWDALAGISKALGGFAMAAKQVLVIYHRVLNLVGEAETVFASVLAVWDFMISAVSKRPRATGKPAPIRKAGQNSLDRTVATFGTGLGGGLILPRDIVVSWVVPAVRTVVACGKVADTKIANLACFVIYHTIFPSNLSNSSG